MYVDSSNSNSDDWKIRKFQMSTQLTRDVNTLLPGWNIRDSRVRRWEFVPYLNFKIAQSFTWKLSVKMKEESIWVNLRI